MDWASYVCIYQVWSSLVKYAPSKPYEFILVKYHIDIYRLDIFPQLLECKTGI